MAQSPPCAYPKILVVTPQLGNGNDPRASGGGNIDDVDLGPNTFHPIAR